VDFLPVVLAFGDWAASGTCLQTEKGKSVAVPNRIKPNFRSAIPLPAPPKFSAALQHPVVTRDDVTRIDTALADWWQRFQTALELNLQVQQPIDCGVASLGKTKIQLRRGTAAQWTEANPVLAEGELGLETDTRLVKAGDGLNPWRTLLYLA
jgi:hypothetical protein